MMYKGYEIVAEAITERAEYSLDDEGNLNEYLANIDCEPDPNCYGVCDNGELIDWVDTLDEVKQCIDKLIKEKK